MARTGRPKSELVLSDGERAQLQRWARRASSAQALALRSRIVWPARAGSRTRRWRPGWVFGADGGHMARPVRRAPARWAGRRTTTDPRIARTTSTTDYRRRTLGRVTPPQRPVGPSSIRRMMAGIRPVGRRPRARRRRARPSPRAGPARGARAGAARRRGRLSRGRRSDAAPVRSDPVASGGPNLGRCGPAPSRSPRARCVRRRRASWRPSPAAAPRRSPTARRCSERRPRPACRAHPAGMNRDG